MNYTPLIFGIISIAGALGAASALFFRGASKENNKMLRQNLEDYKEALQLKTDRVTYLETQVYSQNETINKLSEKQ